MRTLGTQGRALDAWGHTGRGTVGVRPTPSRPAASGEAAPWGTVCKAGGTPATRPRPGPPAPTCPSGARGSQPGMQTAHSAPRCEFLGRPCGKRARSPDRPAGSQTPSRWPRTLRVAARAPRGWAPAPARLRRPAILAPRRAPGATDCPGPWGSVCPTGGRATLGCAFAQRGEACLLGVGGVHVVVTGGGWAGGWLGGWEETAQGCQQRSRGGAVQTTRRHDVASPGRTSSRHPDKRPAQDRVWFQPETSKQLSGGVRK